MRPSTAILQLGDFFYDRVKPAEFSCKQLRWYNTEVARNLGLDELTDSQIEKHFAEFQTFAHNTPFPLALRYHGHQFRHYNSELGDGRGFLLAQFRGRDRRLYDLSTKGTGTTPYSRAGDGRLTLKGSIRELLAAEMLESLGVQTNQILSIYETGEKLERFDESSPARSAVLTRCMHSSIRIGTFQRLGYLEQTDSIKKLVAYCLENYFSGCRITTKESEFSVFYRIVMERCAKSAAEIMMAGFVHAVLNTDNINVTGEIFDLGPYRFLSQYNPRFTAAYFDQTSLYCYGRQPENFLWALDQLAQVLKQATPKFAADSIQQDFLSIFNNHMKKLFFKRLNLHPRLDSKDDELLRLFFEMLDKEGLLFEQAFFDFHSSFERRAWTRSPQKDFYKNPETSNFLEALKNYQVVDNQWIRDAYFQNEKPETLLIHEVESLWQFISLENDWMPLQEKIKRIRSFRGAFSSGPA